MGSTNAHAGTETSLHLSFNQFNLLNLLNHYKAEDDSFLDYVLPVMRHSYHHYEAESKLQSMEWQHVNSPLKKKFNMWVKWYALPFGIGKDRFYWISLSQNRASALTTTMWWWLNWRLEVPESGQRRRQPLSYNTVTSGPIPIWRQQNTLPILAGLSDNTHHILGFGAYWLPSVWENGQHREHFLSNDAVIAAVKQWITSTGADF